ncbi:MAG: hypothetical protein HY744_12645 [Deltaproteobacteria bacterium]|nr:hypothetical protein [Deltaproteobacteria bacterium]
MTTADASAALGLSIGAASQTLRRLQAAGLLWRIRKGLWALAEPTEPLALAEHLTAPYQSYVSLQTALYLHGMIEQIPALTYLVSLSRSHRVRTSVGTFSVHRIGPEFFGGFDVLPGSGVKLATAEKALLDVLYLSGTRSRLFAALPEIELPRSFRHRAARAWIARIPSPRLRSLVGRRFERLLGRGSPIRSESA